MPSPFPGMDPFIESQEWGDFHLRAIAMIADLLGPRLGRAYVARVERRVYVELPDEPIPTRWTIPDVVVEQRPQESGGNVAVAIETAVAVEALLPRPQLDEHREARLLLREVGSGKVVTVLELLSPANKRRGSVGRSEYLQKRDEVLDSDTHLVEIDLLRGGLRMPFTTRTPIAASYVALVSRASQRPRAELYPWSLPERLPVIPIPLSGDDPDVTLDLQVLLTTIYDRSRYDVTLDYTAPLDPPADEATAAWVADVLAKVQN